MKKLVKQKDDERSGGETIRSSNDDEEEQFVFLDRLRESGVTNMFGATSYLERAFPSLTHREAIEVLSKWMETFGERERW